MRAFIAIGLIMTFIGCRIESNKQQDGPGSSSGNLVQAAAIESFTVTPLNAPVGGEVKILVTGSGFEECDLYVNDQLVDEKVRVDQEMTDSRMAAGTTVYKVVCGGSDATAGVAEADKTVSFYEVTRSRELANLTEIKEQFEFQPIEDAVRTHTDESIVEFDADRTVDIPRPQTEIVSWVRANDLIKFNPDRSIVWGYEGNLTGIQADADTRCKSRFEMTPELLTQAKFADPQGDDVAELRELTLPGVHISNFTATTTSPENPVPADKLWDVSFDLEKTVVSYIQASKIYGTASGSFEISDLGEVTHMQEAPQNNLYSGMLSGLNNYVFPWRYPLVPPGNGLYELDPESEECNQTEESAVVTRPLQEIRDAIRRGVLRETDYRVINTRQDIWKDPEVEGADWQRTTLQAIRFYPVGYYLRGKKFPSARIVEVEGTFNCADHFPEIASKMGLRREQWDIVAKLQFYQSKDGRLLHRWAESENTDWDGEPARNECIDRWAGRPFDQYRNRLLMQCENAESFVKKDRERQEAQENQAMFKACMSSEQCKNFLIGLEKWTSIELNTLAIRSHIDSLESELARAKDRGRPFLVPKSDLVLKKLDALKEAHSLLALGKESILRIHRESSADWLQGLKIASGQNTIHSDFVSSTRVVANIEELGVLLSRAEKIGSILIETYSCDYSINGAFRVFDRPEIREAQSVNMDRGFKETLNNIIPIAVGD